MLDKIKNNQIREYALVEIVHELTESVNQNHEHIKWAARAARSKFPVCQLCSLAWVPIMIALSRFGATRTRLLILCERAQFTTRTNCVILTV